MLDRPVYGVCEAAAVLGVRPAWARRWLDGDARLGVGYPPVIRPEPTGDETVTWGEFVELSYLREYRRRGVPLQRLRPVMDELRREFDTAYPLATARPYLGDKELVLEIQESVGIPQAIASVIRSGKQLLLADGARRFVRKVEFDASDPGEAIRVRPAGPGSPVVIEPLVRFGRPSVDGVGTERLWELFDAGETIAAIAARYDLPEASIRAAVAYEEHHRALVVAA